MNPIFLKEHYDYFIYTLADLQELQTRINNGTESLGTRFLGGTTGYAGKKFKLMKDIDMNNPAWTGIGTWTGTQGTSKYFAGTFDGGGHKLTNFSTVNNTSNKNTSGLFIHLYNATVRNLEIIGSYTITANTMISLFSHLFGVNHISQIITNIDVTGINHIGGVLEVLLSSTLYISDYYNFGNFYTNSANIASGIIINNFATCYINKCANFGTCKSASGGAVGVLFSSRTNSTTTITNCLNAGEIIVNSGTNFRAGIWAGRLDAGASITVSKCYNFGSIAMISTNSGQISGTNPTTYSSNFYDSTKYSGAYGVYNGVAKTTAELTDGSNLFSDTANWVYEAGYYPRLNNWLKYDSRVLTALAV